NPADLAAARKMYLTGPLEPCLSSVFPDDIKPMCLNYLTPWLWEEAGISRADPAASSFAPAFAYCDTISKRHQKQRDACFGGFGKEFVVLAAGRDVRYITSLGDDQLRRMGAWCAEAKAKDGILACVAQIVDSLLWGGENDP